MGIMKVWHLVVAASLLFGFNFIGMAQTGPVPVQAQNVRPTPGNCEDNVFLLNATHVATDETGPSSFIIAIARLGDGEGRRELNRRRLHNVRVFLANAWKRPPDTVVTAQGERVKGFGRVDLYVGGRLFGVLAVKTNGDLLVSLTCEPDNLRPKWADQNLYPYLDKKQIRHR